jgi:hypothetical protein
MGETMTTTIAVQVDIGPNRRGQPPTCVVCGRPIDPGAQMVTCTPSAGDSDPTLWAGWNMHVACAALVGHALMRAVGEASLPHGGGPARR